jgi:1,4-dihydroxy-2-naphthoate polyprenyltransferase
MKILEKISLWFKIGRGFTVSQSMVPYIFAVVLASKHCHVNLFLSFLGLISVGIVQLSINILDDYFDWKKGAVEDYKKLRDEGKRNSANKCFYLEQNLVTLNQILIFALSLDAIACLAGLYIASKVGISVIIIAAIAGILSFFYSAPPIRFSYRGMSEVVIGIIFGPLLMAGAYVTAGASFDSQLWFASAMLGLLIANISYTHALTDFDSDIKAGKTSLPTLLKTKDNAIFLQGLIYALTYVILVVSVILKVFPLVSLVAFITLPKAFALVRLMKTDDKEKKFWMGAIENWEAIKQEGAEWFMIRLCISRNLLLDFIVLLGITYYFFT